jgi:hypothetical protein
MNREKLASGAIRIAPARALSAARALDGLAVRQRYRGIELRKLRIGQILDVKLGAVFGSDGPVIGRLGARPEYLWGPKSLIYLAGRCEFHFREH